MQNTGNPVLDSFVNLVTSGHLPIGSDAAGDLKKIHAIVLELASKEPGGLAIILPQGSRKPGA